jgi:hypothetical protein
MLFALYYPVFLSLLTFKTLHDSYGRGYSDMAVH